MYISVLSLSPTNLWKCFMLSFLTDWLTGGRRGSRQCGVAGYFKLGHKTERKEAVVQIVSSPLFSWSKFLLWDPAEEPVKGKEMKPVVMHNWVVDFSFLSVHNSLTGWVARSVGRPGFSKVTRSLSKSVQSKNFKKVGRNVKFAILYLLLASVLFVPS